MVARFDTPLENEGLLLPWKIPPTIRLDQPERGTYLIEVILNCEPRFKPAQSPLPVGPSKNVDRLPSNALATVLPRLPQEPEVPMTAPFNWPLVVEEAVSVKFTPVATCPAV